jgi:DNA-directed RNA polymerase subunit RPC12/RpoP
MDNKEAIAIIQNEMKCVISANVCDRNCEKCDLVKASSVIIEAMQMAIKALKELPKRRTEVKRWKRKALEAQESSSEKPNKSGKDNNVTTTDCIRRADVLAKKVYTETENGWSGYTVDVKDIERLPSVAIPSAEPKTGYWIWQTEDIYKCSECGEDIHVKEVMNVPQYVCCPMCGARMERSDKE